MKFISIVLSLALSACAMAAPNAMPEAVPDAKSFTKRASKRVRIHHVTGSPMGISAARDVARRTVPLSPVARPFLITGFVGTCHQKSVLCEKRLGNWKKAENWNSGKGAGMVEMLKYLLQLQVFQAQ
ncbi:hypothetical protein CERZMDRAFT_98003 [Cercospora zeae-maydis SCOH1-5]|uniref:Uncharacterized protein n=1 Tax=Cercospora zeae-maydis SCOH1-5 TaxID=717836 RepID=A0A6A6FF33_9PEZI|nr:hypothetical protein CERZMDRAFT_98003 [Cercospora zeae-maydis SCOH1-5]